MIGKTQASVAVVAMSIVLTAASAWGDPQHLHRKDQIRATMLLLQGQDGTVRTAPTRAVASSITFASDTDSADL